MPVQTRSSFRRTSPPESTQPPCIPPQKPLAATRQATSIDTPLARRASLDAYRLTSPPVSRNSRSSIRQPTRSARSASSRARTSSAGPLTPISDIEDLGGEVPRGVMGETRDREGGELEAQEWVQASSEEGGSDECEEGVNDKAATRRRRIAAGTASRRSGTAKRLKAESGRGSGRKTSKEDLEIKYGFSDAEVVAARFALMEWYDANKRDLPWRAAAVSERAEQMEEGSNDSKEAREAGGKERGEQGAQEAGEAREAWEEREERRAYGVWVSEVMLQQTRVGVVEPYFRRWLARWPSLPSLASASLEEVNSMWAGLGYYRRAKYLLQGAQHIQQQHGGRMPRTARELQAVPGIGPYTAAAVSSIAFRQPVAAVDGNVMRIMARMRAVPLPMHESAATSLFSHLASQLLHRARPGDFNQALMDLGSLVCAPSSPSCSSCPLSPHCRALALQQQGACRGEGSEGREGQGLVRVTDFPVRKAKAAPREEWVAVCVVERRGAGAPALAAWQASEASAGVSARKGRRAHGTSSGNQASSEEPSQYLLVQRPPTGLLAGLWEFPSLVVASGTGRPAEAQRRRAVKQLLGQMLPCVTIEGSGQLSSEGIMLQEGENKVEGSKWRVIEKHDVGETLHIFSHIHQHMLVERIVIVEGEKAGDPVILDVTGSCPAKSSLFHSHRLSAPITSHSPLFAHSAMAPSFGRPWFAIFNTNPVQAKEEKAPMPPSIDFQPSIRVSQFGGKSQRQLAGVSSSPLVQDHVAAVAMRARLEMRKGLPQSTVRLLDPPTMSLSSSAPRTSLPPAASATLTPPLSANTEAVSGKSSATSQNASAISPEPVRMRKNPSANPPPLTIPPLAPSLSAPFTPHGSTAMQPPHTPGSTVAAQATAIAPMTAESDLVAAPLKVAAQWSREEWLLVVRAVEGGATRCLKCPKQSDSMAAATHGAIHLIQSLKTTTAASTPGVNPASNPGSAKGSGSGPEQFSCPAAPAAVVPRVEIPSSPSRRNLFYTTSSGSSDDTTFVDDSATLASRTSTGSASNSDDDNTVNVATRYGSYSSFNNSSIKGATAAQALSTLMLPSPSGCPRTPFSHLTPPSPANQLAVSSRGLPAGSMILPSRADASEELPACPFLSHSARYSSYETKDAGRAAEPPSLAVPRTMPFGAMTTRRSADASLPVRSATAGSVSAAGARGTLSGASMGMSASGVQVDAMNRKLLTVITKTHEIFSRDLTPNGSQVADYLLSQLLELTQSESGFIASALKRADGSLYLKTHSITNLAWNRDLRAWYTENAPIGLVFGNLKTIFGRVVTSADVVISNDVPNDPRASGQGVPPGHPVMRSFLGVPLFSGPDLVGIYAVSNREGGYNEGLLMSIQPVTKTVAQVVVGVQQRRKKWEAEERLNDMLEATQHAMVAVSADGKLTCANRAARMLFALESSTEGDGDGTGGKLPLGLTLADVLVSIDGNDDYMHRGLDAFAEESLYEWSAEGRQHRPHGEEDEGATEAAGSMALRITVARGSSSDVKFVVTAREADAWHGRHAGEEAGGGRNESQHGREGHEVVHVDEQCELVLSNEDGTLTILA
ncbi:unnamed protein product [Closterium sp. NIES-64]|nr:unnamed protein product [Closterium sp. NIES-64]